LNVTSLKFKYSRTPLIRTLVIRTANYPDRLGLSRKCVENSITLTCLEITGYRVLYSTVLWLLKFQISSGRKILTQVKVKESSNRNGVAQRVPGGLGSQVSMTFGT
jgi:hypothetical protein